MRALLDLDMTNFYTRTELLVTFFCIISLDFFLLKHCIYGLLSFNYLFSVILIIPALKKSCFCGPFNRWATEKEKNNNLFFHHSFLVSVLGCKVLTMHFIKNFLCLHSTPQISLNIHFVDLFIEVSAVALFSISSTCLACPWYLLKDFYATKSKHIEKQNKQNKKNRREVFESNLLYLRVHREGISASVKAGSNRLRNSQANIDYIFPLFLLPITECQITA